MRTMFNMLAMQFDVKKQSQNKDLHGNSFLKVSTVTYPRSSLSLIKRSLPLQHFPRLRRRNSGSQGGGPSSVYSFASRFPSC